MSKSLRIAIVLTGPALRLRSSRTPSPSHMRTNVELMKIDIKQILLSSTIRIPSASLVKDPSRPRSHDYGISSTSSSSPSDLSEHLSCSQVDMQHGSSSSRSEWPRTRRRTATVRRDLTTQKLSMATLSLCRCRKGRHHRVVCPVIWHQSGLTGIYRCIKERSMLRTSLIA